MENRWTAIPWSPCNFTVTAVNGCILGVLIEYAVYRHIAQLMACIIPKMPENIKGWCIFHNHCISRFRFKIPWHSLTMIDNRNFRCLCCRGSIQFLIEMYVCGFIATGFRSSGTVEPLFDNAELARFCIDNFRYICLLRVSENWNPGILCGIGFILNHNFIHGLIKRVICRCGGFFHVIRSDTYMFKRHSSIRIWCCRPWSVVLINYFGRFCTLGIPEQLECRAGKHLLVLIDLGKIYISMRWIVCIHKTDERCILPYGGKCIVGIIRLGNTMSCHFLTGRICFSPWCNSAAHVVDCPIIDNIVLNKASGLFLFLRRSSPCDSVRIHRIVRHNLPNKILIYRRISLICFIHIFLRNLCCTEVDISVFCNTSAVRLWVNRLAINKCLCIRIIERRGDCPISSSTCCLRHNCPCRSRSFPRGRDQFICTGFLILNGTIFAVQANQFKLELISLQKIIFISAVKRLMRRKVCCRNEVVMNIEIWFSAAAFQIEHIECMVSTCFESLMSFNARNIFPVFCLFFTSLLRIFSGRFENIVQIFHAFKITRMICIFFAGKRYSSVFEIDIDFCPVMNTAAISDKHTIYIQPGIIISRKFKLHWLIFVIRVQHLTVCGHGELCIHMHSQPEVLCSKRPESSDFGVVICLFRHIECFFIRIKIGFIVTAVIGVIAIFVDIQQLIDPWITCFAFMWNPRVKQIRKWLSVRTDCRVFCQYRKTVTERSLNNVIFLFTILDIERVSITGIAVQSVTSICIETCPVIFCAVKYRSFPCRWELQRMTVFRITCARINTLIVSCSIQPLVVIMTAPVLVQITPGISADDILPDYPVIKEINRGSCGVCDRDDIAFWIFRLILCIRNSDIKLIPILHENRQCFCCIKLLHTDENPVTLFVFLRIEFQYFTLGKTKRVGRE